MISRSGPRSRYVLDDLRLGAGDERLHPDAGGAGRAGAAGGPGVRMEAFVAGTEPQVVEDVPTSGP